MRPSSISFPARLSLPLRYTSAKIALVLWMLGVLAVAVYDKRDPVQIDPATDHVHPLAFKSGKTVYMTGQQVLILAVFFGGGCLSMTAGLIFKGVGYKKREED